MLSVAKHLLSLIENKQKQILRFAQNDTAQGFFRSLFNRAVGRRFLISRLLCLSGGSFSEPHVGVVPLASTGGSGIIQV